MIALQDITFKHFSESDASAQDKEIDCLNADYLVVQFFTSGGSTSPSPLTGLPRPATMLQRLLSTISDQSPLLLPTGKAA